MAANTLTRGPLEGPRTSGHPVGDIRRMAAWSSCRDPDRAVSYGDLFLQTRRGHDVLIELRSAEDCTDPVHTAERRRRPDLAFCDAGCGAGCRLVPVGGRIALADYFRRRGITAMRLPHGGGSWIPARPPGNDDYAQAWAAQFWPGVQRLTGVHDLRSGTLMRPDGSIVTGPGYDTATGMWCVRGPGQAALPPGLASQLAAVAAAGPWSGTLTELAMLVQWAQHVNALVGAIKAIEPELRALSVMAVRHPRRRTGRTRAAEWSVHPILGPSRTRSIEGVIPSTPADPPLETAGQRWD